MCVCVGVSVGRCVWVGERVMCMFIITCVRSSSSPIVMASAMATHSHVTVVHNADTGRTPMCYAQSVTSSNPPEVCLCLCPYTESRSSSVMRCGALSCWCGRVISSHFMRDAVWYVVLSRLMRCSVAYHVARSRAKRCFVVCRVLWSCPAHGIRRRDNTPFHTTWRYTKRYDSSSHCTAPHCLCAPLRGTAWRRDNTVRRSAVSCLMCHTNCITTPR